MTDELLAEGKGGNLLRRSDRQYERTRPSLEYYDKDLARARKVGFQNSFNSFEGSRYGADRNALVLLLLIPLQVNGTTMATTQDLALGSQLVRVDFLLKVVKNSV
jgi:hypothetical protein